MQLVVAVAQAEAAVVAQVAEPVSTAQVAGVVPAAGPVQAAVVAQAANHQKHLVRFLHGEL